MSLPDFDYIFALRLSLSDTHDSEYQIIQELRRELSSINSDQSLVSSHLINFYNTYNIQIDENIIMSGEDPDDMPELLPVENYEELLNNIIYIPLNSNPQYSHNSLMTIVSLMSSMIEPMEEFEDVVTTLDDSEYCKITNYTLEEKTDFCCSICLDNLEINQQISKLPCTHIFHSECITTYLKEYHRICPVCRAEVGKRKE